MRYGRELLCGDPECQSAGNRFYHAGGITQLIGKDIIIVADTMIMYADVTRQEAQEDGSFKVAISARKFTPEVLNYLFEHITENKMMIEEEQ